MLSRFYSTMNILVNDACGMLVVYLVPGKLYDLKCYILTFLSIPFKMSSRYICGSKNLLKTIIRYLIAYMRNCVPRVGMDGRKNNYIPQYLWDVIICPCPSYLFVAYNSSYDSILNQFPPRLSNRPSIWHGGSRTGITYFPLKVSNKHIFGRRRLRFVMPHPEACGKFQLCYMNGIAWSGDQLT